VKRTIFLFAAALAVAGCTNAPASTARPVDVPAAIARPAPIRSVFLGQGSLEAHGEATPATRLAIERIDISAKTAGDVAETRVEHVFRNDTGERLEGTFRLPLPDGAIVTGLALEIDGKLVEGELVEREKARKAYEQVVDEMRDPALLEWEGGQTFKLRVFPIEARSTKRVVLRFVAPLHRSEHGVFFAVHLPSGDAGVPGERVSVHLDGRTIDLDHAPRAPTGEVLVKVADAAPEALAEAVERGTYVHVHLDPVPRDAPQPARRGPTALILLCDRSRSMLEARSLQAQVASMLLERLGPDDAFTVVDGDVRARPLQGGLRPAATTDRRAALAFLDGDEPDGASDLARLVVAGGEAVRQARSRRLDPVVVYLGDASPTWGETRASELARVTAESLGGAALHVVLLGKSTEEGVARALAEAGHGRLLRPRSEDEAAGAAALVASAARARRIDGLRLLGAEGADVAQPPPSTVYEGDEIEASLFLPAGLDASGLRLAGTVAGKPFSRSIQVASAVPARDVALRWAAATIETLERDGDAHKDQIVALSLSRGVMSRYTSLLVLENEEAYARMQIARKARAADRADVRVSARDLDGTDGVAPGVSPDHLQPGDPEVRVPAPADAQSVVVVFPFGETKEATFEPDDRGGEWVVRFLVDGRTPDGTYDILVRVTHHDGAVEILELPYVVDTQRPHLRVAVHRQGDAYKILASQEISAGEIAAQAPELSGTLDARRQRAARILTDAKRVEVRAPDGQVLSLTHVRLGEFTGTWSPRAPFEGRSLHVVAVDRALNESEMDVELP
jgi:Vault protein inter-alpha-trypsin domain/von Willebrand factor type A domain